MTEPVPAPGAEPLADAGRLAARAEVLLSERLKRRAAGEGPDVERIPRIPRRDGRAALSFAQERLWFLDRLQPGNPIYNLTVVARLRGPLELPLLAACFDEIVRRHEALRTNIVLEDGRPVQVIAPPAARPLRLVDLGAVGPARREAEARRLLAEAAQRPFDLSADPLLRTDIVRLAGDDHVLLLTHHHIVTDDWSIGVLLAELAALYRAYSGGRPSPLPELPIQYADYAQWQRDWLAGKVLEEQLAFWRRHLEGAPAVLDLPADRPRPARQSFRGATLRFTLPEELSAAVRGVARREGATVFMTLLAAFEALLHRLTGQDDLVVGTPIANRGRIELEGLIGLFVNTLAMRTNLGAAGSPPGISFHELMGRVRQTALNAYAHQDLPFEKLVEELQPERDLSRSPIFQVLFQVLRAGGSLELPGLAVELVAGAEGQVVKFDLVLSMSDGAPGLSGIWRYRRDLFDDSTIARLNEQFRTFLAGAVAHPESPLPELPLLTELELQQLWEWNATGRGYPGADLCLHELIARQVERTPEAIAVSFEGQELTYRELAARVRGLALRLRALGVGPEVRVGICVERSLELVVGLLGILEAGGAYVPLDPSYPRERLEFMLEDAEVPVLLIQERLRDRLPPCRAEIVDVELTGEPPSALSGSAAFPDSPAYVIYTSGSTGRPKGAVITHRSIVNRLLWMQEAYGLTQADRVLQKTPLSFDVSVWELFWPLMTGACLVIARPGGHQDSTYLTGLIAAEDITTLHFVPSMLRVFLAAPDLAGCGSLRRVVCSGEALPRDLAADFFERLGAPLYNLYGPTEAAVDVTAWTCEPALQGAVPIGRPVANVAIHLLDAHLQQVPVGVPGELYIGGVQLARGYWRRPALTAERFVPDPHAAGGRLYRTGDLARYLPDGAIDFLGRIDHQVKIRGVRIELGEIEAALARHPDVAEAVIQVSGQGEDRRLVAYVVARSGEPTLTDLRRFLSAILPEPMLPGAMVRLEALPLSPNGKIDRKALPEPEASRPRLEREFVAPASTLERDLAALWLTALPVDRVGVHDNFFELGGNSLMGAILIYQLQAKLGEIVHVVTLFDNPTIAGLAAHLQAEHPAAVARVWGLAPGAPETDAQPSSRVDREAVAAMRRWLVRSPAPVPAEEAVEPKNPPALFVLSPPRSGSTLLRVMLAGHPRLFAPPELELLPFHTLRERREAFAGRDRFRLEGAIRAVMEIRSCSAEEAAAQVAGWEEDGWTTRRFYRWMQQETDGRLLVDKTPTYAWEPAILANAESGFESPLYLHLVRHPGGMVHSFEEAKLDQIFFGAGYPFPRRQLAELVWNASHRNIRDFLAAVSPERQLRVHFEHLVREPQEVLAEICRFLGLDFQPEMARPYSATAGRMTDGIHPQSRMLGDVKFHTHRRVEAAVAESWREHAAPDALGEVTRDLAAELGVAEEAAAPPACLVGLQPGRQQPALFLVHPVFGDVHFYRHLTRALASDRPVYGFQSLGLKRDEAPLASIEEMASHYLAALQRVQPAGPYLLAGSSLGGAVAFEMAQRLIARGEQVALLALIDTWTADPAAALPDDLETEWLVLFYLTGGRTPVTLDEMKPWSPERRARFVLEQAQRAGGLPASYGPADLQRLFELIASNRRALQAYVPQPYPGRTLFLRAGPQRASELPERPWRNLCTGGFELYAVPGEHMSILFPPLVERLAELLREAIDRALNATEG
ncbi:MAG TPA: amino acid adenylation domain-containing protein [Thermoanaerobaculia bacterium]|nr:amino acid adenylation domain-containing protein [Thermoanaerobaculia bacterium]